MPMPISNAMRCSPAPTWPCEGVLKFLISLVPPSVRVLLRASLANVIGASANRPAAKRDTLSRNVPSAFLLLETIEAVMHAHLRVKILVHCCSCFRRTVLAAPTKFSSTSSDGVALVKLTWAILAATAACQEEAASVGSGFAASGTCFCAAVKSGAAGAAAGGAPQAGFGCAATVPGVSGAGGSAAGAGPVGSAADGSCSCCEGSGRWLAVVAVAV